MRELGSYDLPTGWRWVTIKALVGEGGVFIDGDWVESKDQDPDGDVRLIQLADVGDGSFRDRSARFLTNAKALELGCTFLRTGDVLVARMPDPLGRSCIFPGDSKRSVTVVDVCIVRKGETNFHHQWLSYFINATPFRTAVAGLQAGSTRKRISRGNLATIPLPLPPPRAQVKIVAEVDKQFTRLDAGVAALRRAEANLKRYRAAVLKSACEGRLVPTEGAAWSDTLLGQVLADIEAGRSFRCEERPPVGKEIGIVKVSAVTWGTYDETESKTCLDRSRFESDYLVKAGDFLFSRANTIDLVGACVIARTVTKSVMLSDKILRLRFSQDVLPAWALFWLRSEFGRREIERLSTGNQMSMRNIGQDRIRQIAFRLPSLPEQHRIVAEVDRRLSVVDELETLVAANLQRAARLRQAILQRAFEGKLARPAAED